MTDRLPWALQRARDQTLSLVSDIPSDKSCLQGVQGEHHPTWVLGHLLLGDSYLLSLLGASGLPTDFQLLLGRYGPASTVEDSVARYDPLETLAERLDQAGTRRLEVVDSMSVADLARPTPDPVLARSQPTIGHHLDALLFHEGYHAGVLAAWRRRHGFYAVPWAFALPTE